MSINERLKAIDDYERKHGKTLVKVLSKFVAESTVYSALSSKHSPSFELSQAIFKAYPTLNPLWFFHGEGSMFIHEVSQQQPMAVNENTVDYHDKWYDIRLLIKTIRDIKAKIDDVIHRIDNLEKNSKA